MAFNRRFTFRPKLPNPERDSQFWEELKGQLDQMSETQYRAFMSEAVVEYAKRLGFVFTVEEPVLDVRYPKRFSTPDPVASPPLPSSRPEPTRVRTSHQPSAPEKPHKDDPSPSNAAEPSRSAPKPGSFSVSNVIPGVVAAK